MPSEGRGISASRRNWILTTDNSFQSWQKSPFYKNSYARKSEHDPLKTSAVATKAAEKEKKGCLKKEKKNPIYIFISEGAPALWGTEGERGPV